jgi:hypothetical protein
MTKSTVVSAGLIAAAMLAGPAMAQEATQEPAAMGQHYPNSNYLTGGNGVRATPRPGYYFRRDYYGPGPAGFAPHIVGGPMGNVPVIAVAPADAYAYYGGPAYGGPAYYPDY